MPPAQTTSSDLALLLARTADGDRAAFGALYDATAGKLHGVALGILRRADLAEEAVQDAYIRIWRRAPDYDPGRASAIGWMTAIARNRALDMARSKRGASLDEAPDQEALAPLGLDAPEVAPPARVWQAIERGTADLGGAARPALHVVKESVATPEEEPSGGWRIFAIAASLAALALGVLLARDRLAPAALPQEPLVAALSADGEAPAFLVSVDVAQRELAIRRIAAEAPQDKTHELWLVSDKVSDGKPVSLGLVGAAPARAALAKYEPAAFEGATYVVSLEPRGGSKTGQPTGPVVFSGKLEVLPKPGR